MTDKDQTSPKSNPNESPQSHSAFPGARKKPETPSAEPSRNQPPSPGQQDAPGGPIPSQPRSFTPIRPAQNPGSTRKNLSETPEAGKPAGSWSSSAAMPKAGEMESSSMISTPGADSAVTPATPPARAAASSAGSRNPQSSTTVAGQSGSAATAKTGSGATAGVTETSSRVPAKSGVTAVSAAAGSKTPQSSGGGGDTIRLRVNPRPQSRPFSSTSSNRGKQRLPDIRRRLTNTAGPVRYGPISMFIGFIWLVFKMIFFTALVMGIAMGIGYYAIKVYIKRPEVTVPNVSGMKVNEAFAVLADKNLALKEIRAESSGLVAPGEIISQSPPPGGTGKEGTAVGVVISSGRSKFVVPKVIGETRENAVNKIKGAGLDVGNILMIEDENTPAGQVISQTPTENTGLDEPKKVDLMVSKGPPGKNLTMPAVTGRKVIEAKAILKALGIDDIDVEPSGAADDAEVTGQNPLIGKSIFQSDKVTLRTGSGKE